MIAVLTILLLLATYSPAEAQKAEERVQSGMTFTILNTSGICTDCSVIQASGYIGIGTGDAFHGFLGREQLKQDVYFIVDSFGGDLKNGFNLGFKLREMKAKTVVGRAIARDGDVEIEPAACLSACVPAFLGGNARSILKGSYIGVHSWIPAELLEQGGREGERRKLWDQATVENLYRQIAAYLYFLEYMGVDLRLAARTLETPHESMSWVDLYEQRLWKVTTTDSIVVDPLDRHMPILFLRRSAPPLLSRSFNAAPEVREEDHPRSILQSEGR
jgi:hypothetical protein